MIKELLAVAKKMDQVGLTKEADYIDLVIKKLSNDESMTSSLDYLDPDQIVEENMTEEEMSFLEALNNFVSAFKQLQDSGEPGDFDEVSDVISDVETRVADMIKQRSFERSMYPSSSMEDFSEMEADIFNEDSYFYPDKIGPRPSSEKK